MKTAFGLDIAGYSTGKSGFARADLVDKNHIEVTVYEKHIFASKSTGQVPIEDIAEKEKEILVACLRKDHYSLIFLLIYRACPVQKMLDMFGNSLSVPLILLLMPCLR